MSSMDPKASSRFRRPLLRSLSMSTGAMLLYGCWAYVANFSHGGAAAWRAALTQGFVSFSITLVLTTLMEGLHRLSSRPLLRFILPAAGAIILGASYSIGMHLYMGTPELFRTVLPVLLIGGTFSVVYSANLLRD